MIELTNSGNIGIFRLAHGKANALDIELCDAIARAFANDRSSALAAVVLTGRGHIFSAGVDLFRILNGGPSYIGAFLPALSQAIEAIFLHPKPVVVAVNGHAVAGGCVLAAAGDRRLMVRDSGRIGLTELRVGVPFPAIAFEVMRSLIRPQSFHEVVCGAATYPADMAAVLGLVDEVTEADGLLDRALEIATALAAVPPDAYALTKKQSRGPIMEYLQRRGRDLDASVAELWASPGTAESIRKYVTQTLGKPPGPA